ncbi:MAG: DUF721 domain-containing protein [Desulfobulbaceae bacterium]|nr:DUF721 domain-containing protein [Desulfobulbaceae bacterium]
MSRKKTPTKMSELLNSLIQKKGWKKQITRNRVFLLWDQIVGEDIAVHAQPFVVRGRTLWLNVSDSVWMQQLQFQKMTILERVKQVLPGSSINDIRFQLDTSLGRSRPQPEQKSPELQSTPPDPQRKEKFDKMISTLKDEKMRQAMEHLWLKLEQARRRS